MGGRDSGLLLARGTEMDQWPLWIGPVPARSGLPKTLSEIFSANFWPFMVYADQRLDVMKLDIVRAAEDSRSPIGMIVNAMDPDLTALRMTGKKILQYHGWADAAISGEYSVRYYEAVEKYLEHDNRDFYRLFMVPGMEHCGGGPGLNVIGTPNDPLHAFDPEHHILAALVHWVEEGQAPDRIIATKYRDDDATKPVVRTRPVCAYPNIAHWTGRGSVNDAASYLCIAPTK
jgi:feruloyl esterase